MPNKDIPQELARHLREGRAERALQVERAVIDEAARTATLAFASELPYERHWGVEILSISRAAMRQGRLKSGANLLVDHDTRDVVGVIESVEIDADKVARAVVRFGKSARAAEVWQDVVDGIRRNVSVGYLIHEAQLVETRDGVETYRVTDWEPFEVSLVSVPADPSVGVGRAMDQDDASAPAAITQPAAAAPLAITPITVSKDNTMSDITVIDQRNHAADISKIAKTLPGGAEMAMDAIQRGLTVEQFQAEAITKLANKPTPTADIGMDKRELRRYSVIRALNAMANPQDASAQRAAAFEMECSNAVAQVAGKQARGIFLPTDVQKRDITAATGGTDGGNMVATDLIASDFITLLRNAMVLPGLGARMLTGLVGNVAIPKQATAASAYWVAENNAPTESTQTFGQVTMTPKTVGTFTDISRRLLLQSSLDVEALVQQDLATVLGLAIQQAAINGSGASNQPSGLLTRVTASVIGGANGAAPTWANIVALESNVAIANADVDSMAYLVNAQTRGKLKGTSKVSGQNGFVWEAGTTPLNGYRAGVTNAVPSNLTKGTSSGVASAIIFGDFSQLMIGMWGTLDLMVDPYTGSSAGTVRVRALQDVDVNVRYTESFATMVDALSA
jgi:HK97 family phage major capsid protein/HK97 family phage prohead protease